MPLKTMVLGGYGNFGARIARALAGNPTLEVIVAGRRLDRAQALARELGGGAAALTADQTSDGFSGLLSQHRVGLVIHTAGPYQLQTYDVARAAARAGAHYIDLADGRRFVCDFAGAMDQAFKGAGRCGITGASTVPALSSAVVDDLTREWQRIDSIDMCIAPAQSAPRGLATLESVLTYCGAPVRIWREGRWQERPGWGDSGRETFARMRPRRGALCDIPDLELFPAHYRVSQRVMFRAALEVGAAQHGFAALSLLRRAGLIGPPERLAPSLLALGRHLDRFGSSLGGMSVHVSGLNAAGSTSARSWYIAADNDTGPEIPCMAAILLARRMARGDTPPPGARAAISLLPLSAFAPEFARWGMQTDTVDDPVR